jgi:phosphoenolpyruvate phosphomutase
MYPETKAIILAAGRGTRLNKYTAELPKGMLNVFNKPILVHQVEMYRALGITDISIVTGYNNQEINIEGVKYYHNPDYTRTNMVESLFCAEKELEGNVIISYADIIFSRKTLEIVLSAEMDIGVLADRDWKNYWLNRYGRYDFDIESFSVNENNQIVSLGDEVNNVETIDGRYVGMIRLSHKGVNIYKSTYARNKSKFSEQVWMGGRIFENAYMTDFIQFIIDCHNVVNPIWISGGWIEFDTNEDYELVVENESLFAYIFG